MNNTQTTAARSQVEEQVRGLQCNAEDLEKMVDVLRNKVASVTSPNYPLELSKPDVPQPVLVPLAKELESICSCVRRSIDNLRSLVTSIELTERSTETGLRGTETFRP